MIHEALLYLWHSPGSLESTELLNLFNLQGFLHPAEKGLLSTIIEKSLKFHKIGEFVKKVKYQSVESNSNSTGNVEAGLYIKAFATGMDKVLQPFKEEIISLENKFLQNPQLPLTYILKCIEPYEVLFNDLQSMIEVIERDKVHGCSILGRLQKFNHSGIEISATAADVIIKTVNTTFYGQLCNWIVYGEIVDRFQEFFIRDERCPDPDFVYSEECSNLSTSSLGIYLIEKNKRPLAVRKFSINWDMVPMFINEDTAESILFMGRIVWIIRNGPQKNEELKLDANYQEVQQRDVWEGKDSEYYSKIQSLEHQRISVFEFARIMEECRIKLTKYLWSLMLENGSVKEHLQLIRDYYGLGRGELFQQFMTSAEAQTKDSSLNYVNVIQNLNIIFLESGRQLYGENDKSYYRFELAASKSDVEGENYLSRLRLNFEISWPLHIVFHPKAMELYNTLFTFLLSLKKSQINLHKLWQLQVNGKMKIDPRVWTLRHNLMFLIGNLQYYLQVDVIEAHFSLLLKAVENASEFEDIIRVHHEFISNLLSKSFILNTDEEHTYKNKHKLYQAPAVQMKAPSKVHSIIMKLLELSDKFSFVASSWEEELTEPEIISLGKFQNRCDDIVESLLFILYNLKEKTNGQHLYQLLNQLNFNKFYSKNMPNFNITLS